LAGARNGRDRTLNQIEPAKGVIDRVSDRVAAASMSQISRPLWMLEKLAEEIMPRKPGVPVMPVETQPSGFKRLVVRYQTLMPRQ
jgi:hypothetical protein